MSLPKTPSDLQRPARDLTIPGINAAGIMNASWQRCLDQYRLDPGTHSGVPVLTQREWRDRVDFIGGYMGIILDELQHVASVIGDVGYSASVADRNGVMIAEEAAADRSHYCESDRVGSVWLESIGGTNGVGLCLVEMNSISVFLGEHFFPAYSEQACAATPIFGPDAELLGILNLSTRNADLQGTTHRVVMNVATKAAERAGERCFRDRFRREYVLRVSEDGGSPVLLALDEDGCIVGANRVARTILSLSEGAIGSRAIWSVFERTKPRNIVDLCRGEVELRLLRSGKPVKAVVEQPAERTVPGRSPRPSSTAIVDDDSGALSLDSCAGSDPKMTEQVRVVRRIVDVGLPMLLLGETGVGKDVMARAIHAESRRASGPFVAFNCAAIPETLIDSELFGYGSGAFTGANRQGNRGRIAEADGGTLFLDEIGDMPIAQQTRLLRVIETGEVLPLGAAKSRRVDLNIIAATHQDLAARIASGKFREDLYYRLAGAVIHLSPLREREDIVDLFSAMMARLTRGQTPSISPQALDAIQRHRWPGNLREMKHVAQRAVRLAGDRAIEPGDLMLTSRSSPASGTSGLSSTASGALVSGETAAGPIKTVAATAERIAIVAALERVGGDIASCADELGISRATLYRKLKAYRIASKLPN